jgi:cytochrome P450
LHARANNAIPLLMDGARTQGDLVRFWFLGRNLVLLRHPDHIRHVLQENVKNFSKQTRSYAAMRLLLGQGLVTSEGDFWLRQRRIAQPAFHKKRIGEFATAMVELAQKHLERWDTLPEGATVDLAQEMMGLALRVVERTLLSTSIPAQQEVVSGALHELLGQMLRRIMALVPIPLGVPTPRNLRFLRARSSLDEIVVRIISERRRSGYALSCARCSGGVRLPSLTCPSCPTPTGCSWSRCASTRRSGCSSAGSNRTRWWAAFS